MVSSLMVCLTSATHKQKWCFSWAKSAGWGQLMLYHTLTSLRLPSVSLPFCSESWKQTSVKHDGTNTRPHWYHSTLFEDYFRNQAGMPVTFKGHNEISSSIQTFWACALLKVDKCALQKLRSGMHADSFMASSKTEPAWRMVSSLTMPAGRCLCNDIYM